MAIAYRTAGTLTTGTTSLALPYPTSGSFQSGDLLVLIVGWKYWQNGLDAISGWTFGNTYLQNCGYPEGVDSGQSVIAVFYREATGSESGSVTVPFLSPPNTCIGRIYAYSKSAASTWNVKLDGDYVCVSTNNTPAWGLFYQPNLAVGDFIINAAAVNSDGYSFSNEYLSSSDYTFSAITERDDGGTNKGDDCGLLVAESSILTRIGNTSYITFGCTASGHSTAAPAFAVLMLVLHEVFNQTITSPTGIISGETLGSPSVEVLALQQTISPIGIVSDEVFGSPSVRLPSNFYVGEIPVELILESYKSCIITYPSSDYSIEFTFETSYEFTYLWEGIIPEAILTLTNLTPNIVYYIQDDPADPDQDGLIAEHYWEDTYVSVSFGSPVGTLITGISGQEFHVLVRPSGGFYTPSVVVEIREDGQLIAQTGEIPINAPMYFWVQWDADWLNDKTGSNVECGLRGIASQDATIEVGAIRWRARVIPTVYQYEGEIPLTLTPEHVSGFASNYIGTLYPTLTLESYKCRSFIYLGLTETVFGCESYSAQSWAFVSNDILLTGIVESYFDPVLGWNYPSSLNTTFTFESYYEFEFHATTIGDLSFECLCEELIIITLVYPGEVSFSLTPISFVDNSKTFIYVNVIQLSCGLESIIVWDPAAVQIGQLSIGLHPSSYFNRLNQFNGLLTLSLNKDSDCFFFVPISISEVEWDALWLDYISVDIRVTRDDGITWSDWITIQNGDALPLVDFSFPLNSTKVQIRESLTTPVPQVLSPRLDYLKVKLLNSLVRESEDIIDCKLSLRSVTEVHEFAKMNLMCRNEYWVDKGPSLSLISTDGSWFSNVGLSLYCYKEGSDHVSLNLRSVGLLSIVEDIQAEWDDFASRIELTSDVNDLKLLGGINYEPRILYIDLPFPYAGASSNLFHHWFDVHNIFNDTIRITQIDLYIRTQDVNIDRTFSLEYKTPGFYNPITKAYNTPTNSDWHTLVSSVEKTILGPGDENYTDGRYDDSNYWCAYVPVFEGLTFDITAASSVAFHVISESNLTMLSGWQRGVSLDDDNIGLLAGGFVSYNALDPYNPMYLEALRSAIRIKYIIPSQPNLVTYSSKGTRISNIHDLSSVSYASKSLVTIDKTNFEDTDAKVSAQISLDKGVTWSEWTELRDGESIPGIGWKTYLYDARLRLKEEFNAEDNRNTSLLHLVKIDITEQGTYVSYSDTVLDLACYYEENIIVSALLKSSSPCLRVTETTTADFNAGILINNLTVSDGKLQSTGTDGYRISPVFTFDNSIARDSKVYWYHEGSSINIEYKISLNGGLNWSNWISVSNNDSIPEISFGTKLNEIQIQFRQSLSGTTTLFDMTLEVGLLRGAEIIASHNVISSCSILDVVGAEVTLFRGNNLYGPEIAYSHIVEDVPGDIMQLISSDLLMMEYELAPVFKGTSLTTELSSIVSTSIGNIIAQYTPTDISVDFHYAHFLSVPIVLNDITLSQVVGAAFGCYYDQYTVGELITLSLNHFYNLGSIADSGLDFIQVVSAGCGIALESYIPGVISDNLNILQTMSNSISSDNVLKAFYHSSDIIDSMTLPGHFISLDVELEEFFPMVYSIVQLPAIQDIEYKLPFDNQISAFTVGTTVIGQDSNAQAYVLRITLLGNNTGYLTVNNVVGTFINDEILTVNSSPYANVNGLIQTTMQQIVLDIRIDGTSVLKDIESVDIPLRDSEAIGNCEITFKNTRWFHLCNPSINYGLERIEVIIDDTTWWFFIEERTASEGSHQFTVWGRCKAALLTEPFSLSITTTYENMNASEIAADLAGSVSIQWLLEDYFVESFSHEGLPMDGIEQLATTIGGIIRTLPDGSIVARRHFPVRPKDLPSVTPGKILTRYFNITSADYSEEQSMYNSVEVIGKSIFDEIDVSIELEEDQDSCAVVGDIRFFRVYRPHGLNYLLCSTGGVITQLELNVLKEESEKCEINNGSGSISKGPLEIKSYHWNGIPRLADCEIGDVNSIEVVFKGTNITCTDIVIGQLEVTYTYEYDTYSITCNEELDVIIGALVSEHEGIDVKVTIAGITDYREAPPIEDDNITTERMAILRGEEFLDDNYYRKQKWSIKIPYYALFDGDIVRLEDDFWGMVGNANVKQADISIMLEEGTLQIWQSLEIHQYATP